MEKADGKSDACGLHIEKDISELAKHMVGFDYEEALEKFLKRRSKMKTVYTYQNAYIRANCTTKDKIAAVQRWVELGENREHIIFIDTVLMNIYRAEEKKMESIMYLCRAENVQALEIIAVEKYVEEDNSNEENENGDVQNS